MDPMHPIDTPPGNNEVSLDCKDVSTDLTPISEVTSKDTAIEYPGALALTLITIPLALSIFLVALDRTIIGPAVY